MQPYEVETARSLFAGTLAALPRVNRVLSLIRGHYPAPPEPVAGVHEASYLETAFRMANHANWTLWIGGNGLALFELSRQAEDNPSKLEDIEVARQAVVKYELDETKVKVAIPEVCKRFTGDVIKKCQVMVKDESARAQHRVSDGEKEAIFAAQMAVVNCLTWIQHVKLAANVVYAEQTAPAVRGGATDDAIPDAVEPLTMDTLSDYEQLCLDVATRYDELMRKGTSQSAVNFIARNYKSPKTKGKPTKRTVLNWVRQGRELNTAFKQACRCNCT